MSGHLELRYANKDLYSFKKSNFDDILEEQIFNYYINILFFVFSRDITWILKILNYINEEERIINRNKLIDISKLMEDDIVTQSNFL